MSIKACPPWFQILFTALLLAVVQPASADRVVLVDGRAQEGTIVGVRDGSVILRVQVGEIGIPVTQVAQIEMDIPAAFQSAMSAYESDDLGKALGELRPLVETFKGLPTEWAQRATGTLGDIYVRLNDLENAARAYEDFQRLYPGGDGNIAAEVGMARLDAARGNFHAAVERLTPLKEQAMEDREISPLEGAAYGQAFYILGEAAESEGDLSTALEYYLLTVTVFHHDGTTTSQALARANEIRATGNVSVP